MFFNIKILKGCDNMKRPNGNGSITKVKGARRKPYKVTITIGWKNDSGKQIKKCIGYYATAKEAEKVLVDFNINPFNLDLASLTFQDIYERWSKTKYKNVSSSSIVGYSSAYNAVSKILRLYTYKKQWMNQIKVTLQNVK